MIALLEGTYDVCIDATLAPGTLSYGESYFPGAAPDEVLLSTQARHPSPGNDNLCGVAGARRLAAPLLPPAPL